VIDVEVWVRLKAPDDKIYEAFKRRLLFYGIVVVAVLAANAEGLSVVAITVTCRRTKFMD
jgi:hypothetical protein